MELFAVFREIRDPAVFLFCVGIVLYLNRNYVGKEAFIDMKKTNEDLRSEIHGIRSEFVSKEKLTDVLSPIEGKLNNITNEIIELKRFIADILHRGGNR